MGHFLITILYAVTSISKQPIMHSLHLTAVLLLLQDAMYAPYDAEIDFLQDQISVLSDEIAERDKHIETLKIERASVGYEAGGYPGRGSRASSMAPSDEGDRDVELQVKATLYAAASACTLCVCVLYICTGGTSTGARCLGSLQTKVLHWHSIG